MEKLSDFELEKYYTQMNLTEVGLEGQIKLKNTSVAVVGAGGLGCAILTYLAAAGVGKILIIDHDRVEIGNLHRQILYRSSDIGRLKCQVACERVLEINSSCDVSCEEVYLNKDNANEYLASAEIVIDATDNFATRYVINDACVELAIPYVYGAVHQFHGQVALFNAKNGNRDHVANYRTVYSEEIHDENVPNCVQSGVLGALVGMVGSIQALEAIKWILGVWSPLAFSLLTIDGLTYKQRLFKIVDEIHAEESLEMSWTEIEKKRAAGIRVEVVDVRTKPARDIEEVCNKLKDDHFLIVSCKHGIRSLEEVKRLRKLFKKTNVYSLKL